MQTIVKHTQQLIDKIECSLSEEINIIDLARSYHVSPWHFQRLFKALVGDTLGGYIRGRRLTEAARLLLGSDLGLIDIAFRTGFSSHEAFTRSFKSYFDKSPKEFRKDHPKVILKEKPVLSIDLVKHLKEEINHTPKIVMNKEIILVGSSVTIPSPFVSNDEYCDSLYPAWMKLLDKQEQIINRITETFYGVTVSESGNFTEETVNFLATLPVTSLGKLPGGMLAHIIPEQLVAIFEVASVDKETTAKTINYIYGYWLPNSKYDRAGGADYEIFEVEGDFLSDPNLSSKYVIPIKPKIS